VHGNGGLLTTVGDLLRWNENFVSPKVGDAAFIKEEETPGRFNDGRAHDYALGLYVRPYRGVPEVSHSGSTAGYRAFLTRYPRQHVSVAVLCNAANANATQYAHAVAAVYLDGAFEAEPAGGAGRGAAGRGGPGRGGGAAAFEPDPADLLAYPGTYVSDEAETVLIVANEASGLVIKRRPDTTLRMRPAAKDAFAVPSLGTVTFRRGADGRVGELSVKLGRVWDMRFARR
jgi:hypothetical protein